MGRTFARSNLKSYILKKAISSSRLFTICPHATGGLIDPGTDFISYPHSLDGRIRLFMHLINFFKIDQNSQPLVGLDGYENRS